MPFKPKQRSKSERFTFLIGNQCLLLVFSFQTRFSLSLSPCQVAVLQSSAFCLPRRVQERAGAEGRWGGKWSSMFMSLWADAGQRQIGDSSHMEGSCLHCWLVAYKGDAVYGTHRSALQIKTLCDTVLKIFTLGAKWKQSRESNIKRLQGSWQQCLRQRNLACLNSSSREGFFFSPFLPHSLSFFSSRLPTTSWGLSHCGLYFYQQWNTETPFTAAELVSCLEFGFVKASCLPLESSHACVHSLRLAHKGSSICFCCSKTAQPYTAESVIRGYCWCPVTLEQWGDTP